MSDIKVFKLISDQPQELQGSSVALEKSLQSLIEQNMETFCESACKNDPCMGVIGVEY